MSQVLLLAFEMPPLNVILAFAGGLTLMCMIGMVILLKTNYKRCSSNQVLVIFGKTLQGQAAKTVHGGAAFVIPLIQDYRYLSLEPIQIEIPLRGALSIENIRVNVPSVFTVAIGTQPDVMTNAAIRLLDLSVQDIRKQAEEIIFGQLRQVIASMGIEDINRNRDTFLEHIQNSVEPELKKIGLVLINVNITDITDESGYIDAIGKKAASQAIQQARGDVADQEKLGEVRVADADREKAIQVASATKLKEIGTREAQREQAVRLAELVKEQTIGEQTAAYQRDMQVKEAEQLMRISVADANAKAVDGENQSEAKIAASQATLLVQKAEAYQKGEVRKREAEAAVAEAQHRAMAKAAIANAERVEAEERAKFEAPAKAQKARILVDAAGEAERVRLEAEGEAAAIYAKLEAEARGQYEILAKKGEGLKQIVEACGGAKEAFQLMMLEHLDKLAESSAKAISNIKFDKIVVWENGGANGRSNTADFLHKMAGTLPPMMQVMRDIGGVDIPESLARLAGEESEKPATNERFKVEENGEPARKG
ncbi:flotillin family protein [Lacipirellula parvula]|uniref:Inner membrane protein YqiK n=1 Tax=Lacipirellula parvula TaxID=2650471 RepID=A0A5K7X4S9_9BACT|nr:flotillin family protein [Lacipirellula parvula]BBO31694.1 inner membrane protein YqiK [Lacipirellula parvula]